MQGVFDDIAEDGIAYELGISPHTVNTYFQRLYAKLQVCSRPQLIMRVMGEYLGSVQYPGNAETLRGLPDVSDAMSHGKLSMKHLESAVHDSFRGDTAAEVNKCS